jgi:DNA-binding CsgD family transcriptional regulator
VQYLLGVRATVRFQAGDWSGALADTDDALGRPVRVGVGVVPALVVRGRIHGLRGDRAAALAALDAAAGEAGRTGELQWVAPVRAARSEHFRLYDDPEAAAAEARDGLALAVRQHGPIHIGELAFRLRLAGGEEALPPEALDAYRWMLDGDWASAAAEWERRGGGFLRLEALALGDAAAATEAVRGLDALGATRAAARLRGDLRRRGLRGVPRGPRQPGSHPAGLTPRQAEVLALIADGLSNADIAARLRLTPKTVDHHVSAVLARLGVRSRGQAAVRAHKLGISPHSPTDPAT